jgi:putative DNA primase/helicase
MRNTAAKDIARALRGHRSGSGWMACCPAHDDTTPSLSISETEDGKPLVHCHAGCSQQAVISKLHDLHLWAASGEQVPQQPREHRRQVAPRDKDRIARALKVWCEAKPGNGTLVEVYLRSRGLRVSSPRTVRLHAQLRHRNGSAWPAMVGLVVLGEAAAPIGVHRTWLSRDGTAKAPIQPNKMMLGPCRGGAVRLAPPSEPLMIGEGIETCFAAMQATGHAAWAALSTSGMRALVLPASVRDVILLADGDPPGEAAAEAAACRWSAEGKRVRIARSPSGTDFADLLVDRLDGGDSK